MAHSTLHFSFGLLLGSILTVPPLIKAWWHRAKLSRPFARWFVISYALGVVAVVPGILRRLGVPDAVCDSPVMNIFLLYPWINTVKPGAQTSGPLALGACLAVQYLALVAALAWARKKRSSTEA